MDRKGSTEQDALRVEGMKGHRGYGLGNRDQIVRSRNCFDAEHRARASCRRSPARTAYRRGKGAIGLQHPGRCRQRRARSHSALCGCPHDRAVGACDWGSVAHIASRSPARLAPIIRGSRRLAVQARRIRRVDGGGCCGTLATRWRLKLRARAALAASAHGARGAIEVASAVKIWTCG
jgi:hypothetical protein